MGQAAGFSIHKLVDALHEATAEPFHVQGLVDLLGDPLRRAAPTSSAKVFKPTKAARRAPRRWTLRVSAAAAFAAAALAAAVAPFGAIAKET